jgi:hypothetical protein
MFGFDSFTLAVLGSAAAVMLVFALMILIDKGKTDVSPVGAPAKVANAPAKVGGKR